jgi:hypothetical protein
MCFWRSVSVSAGSLAAARYLSSIACAGFFIFYAFVFWLYHLLCCFSAAHARAFYFIQRGGAP